MSKSSSSNMSSMEPRMTSDGRFQCSADNKTFGTREEYDRHISQVHLSNKNW